MGEIKPSGSVKIVTGLIYKEEDVYKKARYLLSRRFGPIDLESGVFLFNHTDYYAGEMGKDLKRRFFSFKKLRCIDGIHKVKILSNNLERRFQVTDRRRINIDPGYLAPGKLILLTTKDYTHRVYIKDGIYAECTLFFKDRSYRPWEWTYPDYKTKGYIDFFNRAREQYIENLKK